MGLGELLWTAGLSEAINHWRSRAHWSLIVVGRDARAGVTGKPSSRVGFPEYHERRDQVHEIVASECGDNMTITTVIRSFYHLARGLVFYY